MNIWFDNDEKINLHFGYLWIWVRYLSKTSFILDGLWDNNNNTELAKPKDVYYI